MTGEAEVRGEPERLPWAAGRFDARRGRKKILFGRMYEDAAIERAAFSPGGRVFCIASAGCTALDLAERHDVTAVDINPVQLAYAQEREAGGPMRTGSAERLVGIGRRLLAPFGWRRQTLESFLSLRDPGEQVEFWNRHLNTAGFRAATDVLFSFTWLRLVYASPLLAALPPRFGRVVRGRLERCWRTHPNRDNPYARALLLGAAEGESGTATRPERRRIRFVCSDAASFLESCPPASFDGFTLSNILDGAPESYRLRLFAALRRAGSPESVVVLRSFGEPGESADEAAANRASDDRSILWGRVEVRRVHGD